MQGVPYQQYQTGGKVDFATSCGTGTRRPSHTARWGLCGSCMLWGHLGHVGCDWLKFNLVQIYGAIDVQRSDIEIEI